MDLSCIKSRVFKRLHAGVLGAVDQIVHHRFKLGASELGVQVFGTTRICRNEGQVDISFIGCGKFHLGLFGSFLEALQGHAVLGQVNALIFFELAHQPIDDSFVEIITPQMCVTIGSLHLDYIVPNLQNRDIKGTTSEIVDGDRVIFFLVQTVSQS